MNKTDKLIVALLFLLLVGWGFFQKAFAPPPPPPEAMQPGTTNVISGATQELTQASQDMPAAPAVSNETATATSSPELPVVPTVERGREQRVELVNDNLAVQVSSWGGGIVSAELLKYRAELTDDSGTLVLDFTNRPAMSLDGLAGVSAVNEFTVRADGSGTGAVVTASTGALSLERHITLTEGCRLVVEDTFRNTSDAAATVPTYGMNLGPMPGIQTKARSRGYSYLGIDTLTDLAGRDVEHWGKKKIPEFFGQRSGFMGCAQANAAAFPATVERSVEQPVSWAAAKNKFFVQIAQPEGGADDCVIRAERDMASEGALKLTHVSAALQFGETVLPPGDSTTRTTHYYVGPKKFSELKTLGLRQDEVMQFGWWAWFRWACKMLLTTLNLIHAVIPNYGVAIILLTIIVKIVFWPLTHKGTESAKKMQKIQPLVAELREKYKDEPQKMQKAQMALYKEHGVNPMASCLPMLVQLPIFIALFTVLRSAVELRFASFLWIADLSEPEGLLADVLPFPPGGLNILPILMTLTMVLQQRLTPTAGDPQQQKMMMIMPVVMLFVLYSMPSALVLYWTVSQSLSIAQLVWQKKKADDEQEKTA